MNQGPCCEVCGIACRSTVEGLCPACRDAVPEGFVTVGAAGEPVTVAFTPIPSAAPSWIPSTLGPGFGPQDARNLAGLGSPADRSANLLWLQGGFQFGDYWVIRRIAQGGMGVVYEADQISLNRVVALKVLRNGTFATEDELRRFRIEAEAAGNIDHPNIVPIYEIGEHDGRLFYSMKRIEGQTLARRVPDYRRKPRAIAELMRTTARAVAEAHRCGVLHRDLKPANVLVDALGQPHVTDFGLAKRMATSSGLTETGMSLGTPGYAPPELASGRGGGGTTASDVYGLGAILYELLTGRPPFVGDSMIDTLRRVVEDDLAPPHRHDPDADRDLETICVKCLEKLPANRYATADALADDLDNWLEGRTIAARPSTRMERFLKRTRRHPLVSALVVLIGLMTVTGGGAVFGLWRMAVSERDQAIRNGRLHQAAATQAAFERDRALRGEQQLAEVRDGWRAEAYANGVRLAYQEWLHGYLAATRSLFEEWGGSTGFEKLYLERLCNSEVWMQDLDAGVVSCIASSPDGTLMAAGLEDGSIRILRSATGSVVRTIRAHQGRVWSIAFHPGGGLLGSSGNDATVRVWGLAGGDLRREFDTSEGDGEESDKPTDVLKLAFSPAGDRLVGVVNGSFRFWDVDLGREVFRRSAHIGGVRGVCYSPDGRRIATCGVDRTVRVFDAESREEQLVLRGHTDRVRVVAFSPDGRTLATGSLDGTVRLWSAEDGRELRILGTHDSHVYELAFRPDGLVVASVGFDRMVRFWDVRGALKLEPIRGHDGEILGVAYDRDGSRIVTASADGTVKVWDATRPQSARKLLGHHGPIWDLELSPDGRWLASASLDGTVRIWETRSGETVRIVSQSEEVPTVAFRPDGAEVLAAGRRAAPRLVDLPATMLALKLGDSRDRPPSRLPEVGGSVRTLTYSPDGRQILTGGRGKVVQVWDAATARLLRELVGHEDAVSAIVFSPDGRRIATAGEDATIRLWDGATGEPLRVLRGHTNDIHDVAFHPDGHRLASAGRDETLRIWDLGSGKEIHTLMGHDGYVLDVAYSPDGARVASVGEDRMLRIWDPERGLELISLRGHEAPVDTLTFSPDGLQIYTAGGDGVIRVWEANPPAR